MDGNGVELGPLADYVQPADSGVNDNTVGFYSDALNAVVAVQEDSGTVIGRIFGLEVFFEQTDCQGTAYIAERSPGSLFGNRLLVSVLPGGPRYFVPDTADIGRKSWVSAMSDK